MAIKRIVVIGPESTGKSRLSEALAKELHTVWVPEYARIYLDNINRPYTEADLLSIAQRHAHYEEELEEEANRYLICDTDLHVIKVWSEAKYNSCHKSILEAIAGRRYDLYLLTYIDVEWQADPQREHPDPLMRKHFYNIYRDIVQNSGVQWVDIRGSHTERLQLAMQAINKLV
jgi:NadR type nicotinamide-nucleotide adenylyltransferase